MPVVVPDIVHTPVKRPSLSFTETTFQWGKRIAHEQMNKVTAGGSRYHRCKERRI